jgi:hypothetical protein
MNGVLTASWMWQAWDRPLGDAFRHTMNVSYMASRGDASDGLRLLQSLTKASQVILIPLIQLIMNESKPESFALVSRIKVNLPGLVKGKTAYLSPLKNSGAPAAFASAETIWINLSARPEISSSRQYLLFSSILRACLSVICPYIADVRDAYLKIITKHVNS